MPVLEVHNLVKHFIRPQGFWKKAAVVRAVDGISFTIEEGEMFGLVGESGSGKSTTGRCILRLLEPTTGKIMFKGENVLDFSPEQMRQARKEMQSQNQKSASQSAGKAGDRESHPGYLTDFDYQGTIFNLGVYLFF